ncbi:MAG TPA: hypothetical protein VH309_10125 [Elusimicrobiota bacterium]|jgi:hypothetical protein|nr:hypothetical protein [Elusimicrobiota bacterium]
MSDEQPRRGGRSGGIFVAVVIGGSAIGVIGWYVLTNRTGPAIDKTGFDLSVAPQTRRAAPVASSAPSPEQNSSLFMVKSDAGVRIGDSNQASSAPTPGPAKAVDKKDQAHADFTEQARKHEAEVQAFSMRMNKKYPILRQYAKDWMSHPDLKKLNDDYMRNHDPVAFIMGLTKAPSLGGMVKQYAGNPAIIGYITEGMKEAPGELTASAMSVLSNDTVAKSLIANVATGLGLPPSITGLISSGADASKIDQKQVLSDVMNSAAAQQGQPAPPPVSISNQGQ